MTGELRGRLLSALRAVAVNPQGLRIGAFPSSMPKLVEMGLVVRRRRNPRAKAEAWFPTPAGREAIRQHGADENGIRSTT
jgi:hypothetical protein